MKKLNVKHSMEETLIYYFSFYFSIKTMLATHKDISKQADNYIPFMVSNKETLNTYKYGFHLPPPLVHHRGIIIAERPMWTGR